MPTPSVAIGRPRPHRGKKPERLLVEVNDQNRPVLHHMLNLLDERLHSFEREVPRRPHHIHLTRIARNLIDCLLTQNPRELLLDPEDVARRGVVYFIDESCWAWIKQQEAARAAALELQRRQYMYYGRGIPGHQYYANRHNYGYG